MSETEYLDQLEVARHNAALGSLRAGEHYGIHLYAGENPVGTTLRAADAALIVAAVNALPKLTAALRAVLAECASAERDVSELLGLRMGLRIASNVGSDTIRAVITNALGGEL